VLDPWAFHIGERMSAVGRKPSRQGRQPNYPVYKD
jgi:hypothetical protein